MVGIDFTREWDGDDFPALLTQKQRAVLLQLAFELAANPRNYYLSYDDSLSESVTDFNDSILSALMIENTSTMDKHGYSGMHTLLHSHASILTGNPIAWLSDTNSDMGGYWRQSPASNGDQHRYYLNLPPGQYACQMRCMKSALSAKIDVALYNYADLVSNPVVLGTGIDLYNATTLYNQIINMPFTTTEYKQWVLQVTTNGRNAANTGNWFVNYNSIYIYRGAST